MKTVDVGAVLDEGPWTGYQKLLILATALTIILDGVDNQLLGVAIPALVREWGVARSAFAPVLASGLVGMLIGGAIAGVMGDRLGRRVALLGSVFVFGVLTVSIVFVDNVVALGILRFFAGMGLGGAMPNATALASEYVPRRRRAFAVTLTVVCIPLGGTVAGLVGAQLLPGFGWRALFGVGGALPLVLGFILLWTLPESPRFLARHRERWPELVRLLRRIGHDVPADAAFSDPREAANSSSIGELFTPEYRRDTLALCASFFCCLLAAYAGVNWLPAMLSGAGFDLALSNYGLMSFNLGGVFGAIVASVIVGRIGSRITMLAMSAGAVAGAVVIASTSLREQPVFTALAMLAWTGGLINGTQTLMYALAAHVYPATVRATGVGTAVAFGRSGGVLSSYAGSWALDSGGAGLFRLLAVMMAATFVALAAVRRHIPSADAKPGPTAYAAPQPATR
jgi:AAHS family 4-hydroxybenzoate transporter-like MFS transporter